jgi:phytoene dehydrogenase-like protein
MTNNYDIIAIGSGHNGLVAAAYMAVAGKKVLVLERQPWFGGGVVTRELTQPGFLHDQHSMAHIFIQANPLIKNDELGLLSKYGLKYVYPQNPMIGVFRDGATLALTNDRQKTWEQIAKFSHKDADAYLRFSELGAAYLPSLTATLYSPPAPVGASYAIMDQSREGRQLFNIMQRSAYDVVTEWFEHERVRLFFLRMISENLHGPEEKGTGVGVFMFLSFLEKYGIGVAEGGSGKLTDALIACIEDHGGTVRASTPVKQVLVKGGRAAGVVAEDGEEFQARDAVIGAIHPHLLSRFIEGLDPDVARDAERTEISIIACLTIHAALNEPLQFKAGAHVGESVMIELMPDEVNTLRQHFDDLRYGRLPQHALIGLGSASNFDPSRVPPGKAIMHAWDYVPYVYPGGKAEDWDTRKGEFAEAMLEKMRGYISNLGPENIIAYHCDSPLDMERTSASFRRGDLHGIASYLYQFGAHRPTPELGQNKVPGIEGMYLVGPFQHPGGGVFGAGRATAMTMCEDMKIDFNKLAQHAS